MTEHKLWVDGGGTPTVTCYFSYLDNSGKVYAHRVLLCEVRYFLLDIEQERWRIYEELPIVDHRNLETNNLAEYAALYCGLLNFKEVYGCVPVTVYHDSELVVRQVNGIYECRKPHLQKWNKAVLTLKWEGVNLVHIGRKEIVKVLGH